jgi:UDP:flavonoid glycosyltransferase YjiC (YdhE family)
VRILLGAFGDPGHAFPVIALGRALRERGHEVVLQTWQRWRRDVEALGMRFEAAPEYHVFPTREKPLKPYQAVVRAAETTGPLIDEVEPDAVVADIITLAPALAAEVRGVPVATLVPHVFPVFEPGWPPFSIGARLPRTALGRAFWGQVDRVTRSGLEQGREELNETRRRLGLAPLDRVHGGISERLALVATFPQLEYPRDWPAHVHVVGPLAYELPCEDVELPPGDDPLVLVAPSTVHDPEFRLLRETLDALAGEPVRVIAAWNRRPAPEGISIDVPANARLVEWLSYARVMPQCDVVVCHVGHGTMARALASGCTVVACAVAGDQNENAARLDWAGVGVRLPRRYARPAPLRLAVRRALHDRAMRARARELQAWAASHSPAGRAADLVEGLARSRAAVPQ